MSPAVADPAAPTATRLVVGVQSVREAVCVHRTLVRRIAVEERSTAKLEALVRLARDQGVREIIRLPRAELDRLSRGVCHQGAAAWVPLLGLIELEHLLNASNLLALALDEIQDPQNFGAIVRSAVGLGNSPVLWGEHSSAPLSLATFRASAGAIEHARLCRVTSLRQAVLDAQERGVQVVGLDMRATSFLHEVDLTGPSILVIGGEHHGIRNSLKRACTCLARLAGMITIQSLNASVAAGIALYEALIQRTKSAS
jgi:23S rRNA (guanosine2251-2'-O)-methyltransferase